jgi:hypothetical protein
MKKALLPAVAVLLLAGAGVAYTATSPSAKLAKQDRLYGGGQFGPGCFSNSTVCFSNPRNFAVDAHAQGDGTDAVGDGTYGTPGITQSTRSVTCLRVEGNAAAIGGVIQSGDNAGAWYAQYFVDRGGPGFGERDLASPSFVDAPGAADWPDGFPYTCPSPSTGFPAGPPIFLEVGEGDVVVQDAASK